MGIKTVKFGGSSLADAEHFKKVADIIKSDPERRYVVPSAPGKRNKNDTKVTDMLYETYRLARSGMGVGAVEAAYQRICDRYNDIIRGLGLNFDISGELEYIKQAMLLRRVGHDFAASRGEYLKGSR